MYAPVTLPVALTNPTVLILPPRTLPVALTNPTVLKLPLLMLPVVEIVFDPNPANSVVTFELP